MTHDVFVSFRGVEMRKTFVSHLLSSFKNKHITSYIASEPFEDLDHEAMEKSLVAIPVISKSHTASGQMMKDLTSLMECEKIRRLTAIPIFFQVNHLDILSFAEQKYVDTQDETLEMVRKWMCDLVSRKSSFHSGDWVDDSELVDKITSFVFDILTSSPSSYHSSGLSSARSLKLESEFRLSPRITGKIGTTHWRSFSLPSAAFTPISLSEASHSPLLDMKCRLQELRAIVLRAESTVIGICGMEGVGKTTLAKLLYEEISPRFQHHVYRKNFITRFQCPLSFLEMLPNEEFQGPGFHGSSDDSLKEMIGHRKVLLVADGVDDTKHLKYVMKIARWFGPGSRIIAITQDRSLLTECGVEHIYEFECPSYEDALVIFSEFAFKQRNPLPGFEDFSFRAVHVANRLPLGLKVLGSYLHDKDRDEWASALGRLEESRDNYFSEVSGYIGADDYAPRRPIKVDRHIGIDETNCFPLYCFAFK